MDEWELDEGKIGTPIHNRAHMKIVRVKEYDGKYNYGAYFTKRAQEAMGNPEYVRFYINKERKAIKVESCTKHDKSSRQIRQKHGISGAPNLVKKYGLPLGYYVMTEPGVFYWEV